mgnify:CR=1 FL=1
MSCYDYEEVHESVEGEEAVLLEFQGAKSLFIGDLLHLEDVVVQSFFALWIERGPWVSGVVEYDFLCSLTFL